MSEVSACAAERTEVGRAGLTNDSCTAPQRQVAVAVPSDLTPEAPSDGRRMFLSVIVVGGEYEFIAVKALVRILRKELHAIYYNCRRIHQQSLRNCDEELSPSAPRYWPVTGRRSTQGPIVRFSPVFS